MVNVPKSTIEKPLTAIDYCAALEEQCKSVNDVQQFADQVPIVVLHDERFAKAVKKVLDAIKDRKAAA